MEIRRCVSLLKLPKGYFPLGGIFHMERHFLLFKDKLEEGGLQKTEENIILRGKFHLVETALITEFHSGGSSVGQAVG